MVSRALASSGPLKKKFHSKIVQRSATSPTRLTHEINPREQLYTDAQYDIKEASVAMDVLARSA